MQPLIPLQLIVVEAFGVEVETAAVVRAAKSVVEIELLQEIVAINP